MASLMRKGRFLNTSCGFVNFSFIDLLLMKTRSPHYASPEVVMVKIKSQFNIDFNSNRGLLTMGKKQIFGALE
jgi:hypothetical protein